MSPKTDFLSEMSNTSMRIPRLMIKKTNKLKITDKYRGTCLKKLVNFSLIFII